MLAKSLFDLPDLAVEKRTCIELYGLRVEFVASWEFFSAVDRLSDRSCACQSKEMGEGEENLDLQNLTVSNPWHVPQVSTG